MFLILVERKSTKRKTFEKRKTLQLKKKKEERTKKKIVKKVNTYAIVECLE